MKRRWATVGGIVEVGIGLATAVLLWDYLPVSPVLPAFVLAFAASGTLAVLGGERDRVAGFAWYQLFGLAHLALALGLVAIAGWQVVTHLDRPGSARTLWNAALLGLVAAFQVVLAAMWYTGRGIDLDRFESGPLFG